MKYVYFLKAGENHYKVGVATSVNKRVSGIQTSNPVHIDVVATKLVTNAEEVESNIHKALKEMKADGGGTEWFQLTPAQAVEVAILINKNPEIDISEQVTMSAIMRQQKWLQKMINNKLDQVINIYQRHPIVKEVKNADKNEPARVKETVSDDDLMAQALEVFQKEGKASTSLLQRKLSVGYGKAARVMDKLEEAGFISEADGAKPRILIGGKVDKVE
ncbi:MAG: DNA translocase FtsK [Candidatus Saccharimonadales bacterium]